jgi:hypothetical protein
LFEEVIKVNLPDYSGDIWTYVDAFLNWSPFVVLVTISVAAAATGIVVSLFVRAFMRG